MEKISILKGKWLKKEVDKLQSKGMSKADIARQLDVLPQYINSLMSGARNITDQFLDKFIETYRINHLDLLPESESFLSDKEHSNSHTSAIEDKLLANIREMAEEIDMLKQTINQLEREKEELVSVVNGFRSANVG